MKTHDRKTLVAGIAVVLAGLSGCIVAPARGYHDGEHDRYRYENGDRIDRDGRREEHWCEHHRDDDHCHR